MKLWLQKQENLLSLILIIFYTVGLLGFTFIPNKFCTLTPFNLILTSFILFKLHPEKDLLFYLNLFFVFIGAWFLEMIGVTTGAIFGNYQYGNALGFKLNQTPIIIGLNWIIVAYSSIQMVQIISLKLKLKINEILGAFFAAFFMVLLDFFIEPIAPKLDFWYWENRAIPIQNYTAWFFFGFAFCYWMLKGGLLKNNPMVWRVYLVQILFFASLNLIL
jgi:putative membrane protein